MVIFPMCLALELTLIHVWAPISIIDHSPFPLANSHHHSETHQVIWWPWVLSLMTDESLYMILFRHWITPSTCYIYNCFDDVIKLLTACCAKQTSISASAQLGVCWCRLFCSKPARKLQVNFKYQTFGEKCWCSLIYIYLLMSFAILFLTCH